MNIYFTGKDAKRIYIINMSYIIFSFFMIYTASIQSWERLSRYTQYIGYVINGFGWFIVSTVIVMLMVVVTRKRSNIIGGEWKTLDGHGIPARNPLYKIMYVEHSLHDPLGIGYYYKPLSIESRKGFYIAFALTTFFITIQHVLVPFTHILIKVHTFHIVISVSFSVFVYINQYMRGEKNYHTFPDNMQNVIDELIKNPQDKDAKISIDACKSPFMVLAGDYNRSRKMAMNTLRDMVPIKKRKGLKSILYKLRKYSTLKNAFTTRSFRKVKTYDTASFSDLPTLQECRIYNYFRYLFRIEYGNVNPDDPDSVSIIHNPKPLILQKVSKITQNVGIIGVFSSIIKAFDISIIECIKIVFDWIAMIF